MINAGRHTTVSQDLPIGAGCELADFLLFNIFTNIAAFLFLSACRDFSRVFEVTCVIFSRAAAASLSFNFCSAIIIIK